MPLPLAQTHRGNLHDIGTPITPICDTPWALAIYHRECSPTPHLPPHDLDAWASVSLALGLFLHHGARQQRSPSDQQTVLPGRSLIKCAHPYLFSGCHLGGFGTPNKASTSGKRHDKAPYSCNTSKKTRGVFN